MFANAEANAEDYFLGNKCIHKAVLKHIRLQLFISSVNVISFLAHHTLHRCTLVATLV